MVSSSHIVKPTAVPTLAHVSHSEPRELPRGFATAHPLTGKQLVLPNRKEQKATGLVRITLKPWLKPWFVGQGRHQHRVSERWHMEFARHSCGLLQVLPLFSRSSIRSRLALGFGRPCFCGSRDRRPLGCRSPARNRKGFPVPKHLKSNVRLTSVC